METLRAVRTPARREFLASALAAAAGAALLAATAVPARAQDPGQGYPDKPVRLIVNFPPAGPLDLIARQLAARLGDSFRQPVTVENVAGAAGAIGASRVARAQPDGYTVLVTIDAPFTSSAALSPKTAVPLEEFQPVALLGSIGLTLVVHPSLGVQTVPELLERGRREPVTFSTAGIGSPGHFGALMLADATGVKVTSVHYKGNAPAVTAVLSGEVQAGVLGTTALVPHVKSGKLKGLFVVGAQRSSLLPELPTGAEAGYPALNMETAFVAMVPAKTPAPVVAALRKGIGDAMAAPDMQARLKALDISPSNAGGAEALATLQKARTRYQEIVRATGMKAEE